MNEDDGDVLAKEAFSGSYVEQNIENTVLVMANSAAKWLVSLFCWFFDLSWKNAGGSEVLVGQREKSQRYFDLSASN